MSSQSPESLVEERVAQLKVISERRNELLRQMYHMMQKRRNSGAVLDVYDDDDDDDLHIFLDKYDLEKNPQTGFFSASPCSESFAPIAPERRRFESSDDEDTHGLEQHDIDSPQKITSTDVAMPLPPHGPTAASQHSEHPPSPHERPETPMEVDEKSSPPQLRSKHEDELESDDILVIASPEGRPLRITSTSNPRRHIPDDDDDDIDELDIIGPLSSSHSPSETSVEPRTRTTTRATTQTTTQTTTQGPSRRSSATDSPRSFVQPSGDENIIVDVTMNDQADQASPMDDEHMEVATPAHQEQENVQDPTHAAVHSHVTGGSSSRFALSQQPLVHSVAVEVPHRQMPLFITAPSSPIPGLPVYNFDVESTPEPEPMPSISPKQHRSHFSPIYNLPPLKILPTEFNRKPKPTKQQRKREKEREKNERGTERDGRRENKEDWVPMGINKWGAAVRANPVYKKVSRASKCLSTKDWNVSWTELRLIRTLERVELMKDAGRWSFRQPKKQRGTGGLTKTHWDYLMDEMKWMRTDFREERKWKMALAYNLSTAVLEWHAAGSLEERVRRRICVLWKRPRGEEMEGETAEVSEQIDLDDPNENRGSLIPMVDYNSSDNDDDDVDPEQKDVTDALNTSATVQEALDGVEASAAQEPSARLEYVELKIEEPDDSSVLHGHEHRTEEDSMDIDTTTQQALKSNDNDQEIVLKTDDSGATILSGLKSTSDDPILASSILAHSTDAETSGSNAKSVYKPNIYAPMRERIIYSNQDKLFLDLDDYDDLVKDLAALSTEDSVVEAPPPPPDLSAIFPDLQPFGLMNVPPVPITSTSTEAKKKSDRKSDRDDPNKRVEDTTYTKLVPLGRFMHCKPTLLGPLNPAKRWKEGQWLNQEDALSNSENDNSTLNESLCDLFAGTRPSAASERAQAPKEPKDARRRMVDQQWTPNDDILLKTLVERYPQNWSLVADAFNSSRVTISVDHRLSWDCYERWHARWGAGSTLAKDSSEISFTATLDGATPPPPAPHRDQMTTRGVKRLANVSVGGHASPGSSGSEPKKRRRHNLMFDAIRKAAKKRDQNQKANAAQKKPAAVHDTHGQYAKMAKYSPAELSRIKADKEQKDQEQAAYARRQHEVQRQQMLQQQQQTNRMQGVPMAQQVQMVQQQQPNGAARPPGPGLPAPQGVPQIRNQVNISQQQRIPTPMTAGTRQQLLQVQAQAAQRAIQAQAVQNATANLNGMVSSNMNNSHLSPPYNNRATTSSPMPHSSPPHPSATPSNAATSPRPPSAQPQGNVAPAQVPGNALPRQTGNMGHYFPAASNMQNISNMPITQEQMEHAIRMQLARQASLPQGSNAPYP